MWDIFEKLVVKLDKWISLKIVQELKDEMQMLLTQKPIIEKLQLKSTKKLNIALVYQKLSRKKSVLETNFLKFNIYFNK